MFVITLKFILSHLKYWFWVRLYSICLEDYSTEFWICFFMLWTSDCFFFIPFTLSLQPLDPLYFWLHTYFYYKYWYCIGQSVSYIYYAHCHFAEFQLLSQLNIDGHTMFKMRLKSTASLIMMGLYIHNKCIKIDETTIPYWIDLMETQKKKINTITTNHSAWSIIIINTWFYLRDIIIDIHSIAIRFRAQYLS